MNAHTILIVGRDERRRHPYFVLRCTCGAYTTVPFPGRNVRDIAEMHSVEHDHYTINGPFREFIINEQP